MNGSARSGPRLFALLGWPVEHSLSPAIHGAAFRELGIDADYVCLPVREDEVDGVLSAVARAGGGNVTVPHKEYAARLVDRPSDDVRRTGACNCFWAEDDEVADDDTDVGGFRAAVEAWPEARIQGGRILLLGAGGAARGVVAACRDVGAASVEIWNRTTDRARGLVRSAGDAGPGARTELGVLASRWDAEGPYDLVVNATSLGLEPDDPLPLELTDVEASAVFDLVYGRDGTPWTRHAAGLGLPVRDGLEMLVRQAGLSLRRWLDVDPPLRSMREAARSAAGRAES